MLLAQAALAGTMRFIFAVWIFNAKRHFIVYPPHFFEELCIATYQLVEFAVRAAGFAHKNFALVFVEFCIDNLQTNGAETLGQIRQFPANAIFGFFSMR